MARITTLDCEQVVPNRFELVLLAAARARALNRGEAPRVWPNRDKPTVIALREIGTGALDPLELRQQLQEPPRDVSEDGDPNDSLTTTDAFDELHDTTGTNAAEGIATIASPEAKPH